MEHARRVARAFAAGDKELDRLAQTELSQIEESISTLRAEADLIRGMIGSRDPQNGDGTVLLRPRDATRHSGGKLTSAERRSIYQVIGELLAKRDDVTPADVVAEAEQRGIRLRTRWALPESAVGTMLHFARKKAAVAKAS